MRSVGMRAVWFLMVAGVFGPSLAWPGAALGEFALKDGDTVVFLGDSITAARTYGKIVENYTLLRFPDRKVRFINAGWGGDTAAGGLKRLDRDVLDRGATVLIVAYGINDIGWGTKADAEHKRHLPRRDPGYRREMQGEGRSGLHRVGGGHRRETRDGREGVPPGDVRRGDGAGPIAGRAFHRHPAHDAANPAERPGGECLGQTERPGDPPCRRRHPPQRPGPTGDGVRDPQGPGRRRPRSPRCRSMPGARRWTPRRVAA